MIMRIGLSGYAASAEVAETSSAAAHDPAVRRDRCALVLVALLPLVVDIPFLLCYRVGSDMAIRTKSSHRISRAGDNSSHAHLRQWPDQKNPLNGKASTCGHSEVRC